MQRMANLHYLKPVRRIVVRVIRNVQKSAYQMRVIQTSQIHLKNVCMYQKLLLEKCIIMALMPVILVAKTAESICILNLQKHIVRCLLHLCATWCQMMKILSALVTIHVIAYLQVTLFLYCQMRHVELKHAQEPVNQIVFLILFCLLI